MKYTITAIALLFVSTSLFAGNGDPIERLEKETIQSMTKGEMEDRMTELTNRLEEIHSMDLRSMDKQTRKETKKEVRYIQKESRALANGGIYLSTGAIIIILLVLVILL